LADSVDWPALLTDLDRHGCHTWILYGSLARGDAHPTSDIDLLGIRDDGEPDRDTRVWNGRFLDVFIYAASRFETVGEDWLHLRRGRVLRERDGSAGRLLAQIETVYQSGPQRLADHERRSRVTWLHKMAERIGGRGPDDVEANYRRAWLLTQILEDYFRLRDRWYLGPKESLLWLKAEEPDVYAMFAEALTPAADLAAIRRLVDGVTALTETSLRRSAPADSFVATIK
jgi:predicted nucleotidyltransferase